MTVYEIVHEKWNSPKRRMIVIVSSKLEEQNCKACPKWNDGILKYKDAKTGQEFTASVETDHMICPCEPIKSRAFVQPLETIEAFKSAGKWEDVIKYVEEQE